MFLAPASHVKRDGNRLRLLLAMLHLCSNVSSNYFLGATFFEWHNVLLFYLDFHTSVYRPSDFIMAGCEFLAVTDRLHFCCHASLHHGLPHSVGTTLSQGQIVFGGPALVAVACQCKTLPRSVRPPCASSYDVSSYDEFLVTTNVVFVEIKHYWRKRDNEGFLRRCNSRLRRGRFLGGRRWRRRIFDNAGRPDQALVAGAPGQQHGYRKYDDEQHCQISAISNEHSNLLSVRGLPHGI